MLEPYVPVFVDMGAPVKTQAENGLSNLFDFQGQTIHVSDQAVFILKDSSLHYKEEIRGSENTSPWMDRKRSSFPSLTDTDNTNWETAAV